MTTKIVDGMRVTWPASMDFDLPYLADRYEARGCTAPDFRIVSIEQFYGERRDLSFPARALAVGMEIVGCRDQEAFYCIRSGILTTPVQRHLRLWGGMKLQHGLGGLSVLTEDECVAVDRDGGEGILYAGVAKIDDIGAAAVFAAGELRQVSFIYFTADLPHSPVADFSLLEPLHEGRPFSYREGPLEAFGMLSVAIPPDDCIAFYLQGGDGLILYMMKKGVR